MSRRDPGGSGSSLRQPEILGRASVMPRYQGASVCVCFCHRVLSCYRVSPAHLPLSTPSHISKLTVIKEVTVYGRNMTSGSAAAPLVAGCGVGLGHTCSLRDQGPALSPGLQARWGPLSAAPRPREVSAARWGPRPILKQSRRLSWSMVVGLSSAAERTRVEESCQTQPAW